MWVVSISMGFFWRVANFKCLLASETCLCAPLSRFICAYAGLSRRTTPLRCSNHWASRALRILGTSVPSQSRMGRGDGACAPSSCACDSSLWRVTPMSHCARMHHMGPCVDAIVTGLCAGSGVAAGRGGRRISRRTSPTRLTPTMDGAWDGMCPPCPPKIS